MPHHVGVIMDGNRRWALKRGLLRIRGYQEGVQAAKRCIKAAIDYGINYLSLYGFSTENWNRSSDEVGAVLNLIASALDSEQQFYTDNRIRILHSGSKERIPKHVVNRLERVQVETEEYTTITLNLAINYGGRNEIVRAVHRFHKEHGHDREISMSDITEHLDIPLLPYPDLIIRTGGEYRLSNFLLWGSAYAELYFSETLWPDWQHDDFELAIQEYSSRKRNFGGR